MTLLFPGLPGKTRVPCRALCLLLILLGGAAAGRATTIIPISDAELYRRADVVVHGIVLTSDVTVDDQNRPETLTLIQPIAVLKGSLSGSLAIHQLGESCPTAASSRCGEGPSTRRATK